jgi:hypothetical protein
MCHSIYLVKAWPVGRQWQSESLATLETATMTHRLLSLSLAAVLPASPAMAKSHSRYAGNGRLNREPDRRPQP